METEVCKRCLGAGKCPACNGTGKITKPQVDGLGTAHRRVRCEACVGTGKCLSCQPLGPPPDRGSAILAASPGCDSAPRGRQGAVSVEAKTIDCDARQPNGLACGETAIIHKTHHHYANTMYAPGGGGRFQQILLETHYEIECPHCGRRTQVVKTASSAT